MQKNLLQRLVAIPFFVASLASSGSALATVIYETGFEAPAYADTVYLSGEDGWTGPVSVAGGFTHSLAGLVKTGAQAAAFIEDGGAAGQFLAVHALSYDSVGNPETLVKLEIDAVITRDRSPTAWDILLVVGNAGFIGQVGIDFYGNATLVNSNVAVPISFGVFQHYELFLDYSDGSMDAYMDNIFIGSAPMASASTTLDFVAIGINNHSGGFAGDYASFDNLSIASIASVPVPATILLLGIGLAGLGWARRPRAGA